MDKSEALDLMNLPSNSTDDALAVRYVQVSAFFASDSDFHPKLMQLILRTQADFETACALLLPNWQAKQATSEQVNIMERTRIEHWQRGGELNFETVTGKRKLDKTTPVIETCDMSKQPTLKGQYMSLTLRRLLINIPLKKKYAEDIVRFTLVEMLFHNVWDYPLNAFSSAKLIDTEGFQHGQDCRSHSFDKWQPDNQAVPISFPPPESPLEDHCKSVGWLWFDEMPKEVLPQRLIVAINLFEPGQTSGWVKDTETLEFFIKDCTTSAVRFVKS